jgi:hypothetical protein
LGQSNTGSSGAPDGSIDEQRHGTPGMFIDELRDGAACECPDITVEGKRALAAALLTAVDEIAGWIEQ